MRTVNSFLVNLILTNIKGDTTHALSLNILNPPSATNNNKLQLKQVFRSKQRKYLPGNSCLLLASLSPEKILSSTRSYIHRCKVEKKKGKTRQGSVEKSRFAKESFSRLCKRFQILWRICLPFFSAFQRLKDRCFALFVFFFLLHQPQTSHSLHRDDIMALWKLQRGSSCNQKTYIKSRQHFKFTFKVMLRFLLCFDFLTGF